MYVCQEVSMEEAGMALVWESEQQAEHEWQQITLLLIVKHFEWFIIKKKDQMY